MPRLYLVAALATLILAACELPRGSRPDEDEMFTSSEFQVMDRALLWTVLERECERMELRFDNDASSMRTGEFETAWSSQLSPFRYEGTRKKFVGQVVESEERPGHFRLRVATWMQRNADMRSLDSKEAIWQDLPPEEGRHFAELLIFQVQRHFVTAGPSKRFYGEDEDSRFVR